MSPSYEEIDHTADWALRLQGKDMGELCLNAAAAMLAACGARPGTGPTTERHLTLRATDGETLLVRWLQEILLCLEMDNRVPTRIEVSVSPTLQLDASWQETALDGVEKPIKAVTYHDLQVRQAGGQLEATVVFDV